MINQLNKLIEQLTQRGAFASTLALFVIYGILKLYTTINGK